MVRGSFPEHRRSARGTLRRLAWHAGPVNRLRAALEADAVAARTAAAPIGISHDALLHVFGQYDSVDTSARFSKESRRSQVITIEAVVQIPRVWYLTRRCSARLRAPGIYQALQYFITEADRRADRV